jgi:hypothetical protein
MGKSLCLQYEQVLTRYEDRFEFENDCPSYSVSFSSYDEKSPMLGIKDCHQLPGSRAIATPVWHSVHRYEAHYRSVTDSRARLLAWALFAHHFHSREPLPRCQNGPKITLCRVSRRAGDGSFPT